MQQPRCDPEARSHTLKKGDQRTGWTLGPVRFESALNQLVFGDAYLLAVWAHDLFFMYGDRE